MSQRAEKYARSLTKRVDKLEEFLRGRIDGDTLYNIMKVETGRRAENG